MPGTGKGRPGDPQAAGEDRARLRAFAEVINPLLTDRDADDYLNYADSLKGQGQYEKAAVFYLVAIKMQPTLLRAQYQLACDFSLWRQSELAMKWLTKAVAGGYWGYEMMKDDSDLGPIRTAKGFDQLLAEVKKRYSVEAPKHAGGSLLRKPRGKPPAGGWPVLLLLHGYGANKENFEAFAELAAERGLAGLAASAPVVMDDTGYRWPDGSVEETHTYLQKILQGYRSDRELNLGRVFVGGFSQGALYAALLVAARPASYSGALSVSPGGMAAVPAAIKNRTPSRPLFLIGGTAEHGGNIALKNQLEKLWQAAGWPVRVVNHEGGHIFPENFNQVFADAVVWLNKPATN